MALWDLAGQELYHDLAPMDFREASAALGSSIVIGPHSSGVSEQSLERADREDCC
jgi:hypothetical protein